MSPRTKRKWVTQASNALFAYLSKLACADRLVEMFVLETRRRNHGRVAVASEGVA